MHSGRESATSSPSPSAWSTRGQGPGCWHRMLSRWCVALLVWLGCPVPRWPQRGGGDSGLALILAGETAQCPPGSKRIDCFLFSRDELMDNDQLINTPSFDSPVIFAALSTGPPLKFGCLGKVVRPRSPGPWHPFLQFPTPGSSFRLLGSELQLACSRRGGHCCPRSLVADTFPLKSNKEHNILGLGLSLQLADLGVTSHPRPLHGGFR